MFALDMAKAWLNLANAVESKRKGELDVGVEKVLKVVARMCIEASLRFTNI